MTSAYIKMLAGEMYSGSDPELVAARARARDLIRRYNATTHDALTERQDTLKELFGTLPDGLWIEPPFYCDYGNNITFGDRVYMNFGCVVLDCARVTIGEQIFFGPNVQLLTAGHPLDPDLRATGEFAHPITIGKQCWLGGGVIVCPGVSIGDGTTIGAGSVVTRDIPTRVVAVGNPCRVLRTL